MSPPILRTIHLSLSYRTCDMDPSRRQESVCTLERNDRTLFKERFESESFRPDIRGVT